MLQLPKCGSDFFFCNKWALDRSKVLDGNFDLRIISEAGAHIIVIKQKIETLAGKGSFSYSGFDDFLYLVISTFREPSVHQP